MRIAYLSSSVIPSTAANSVHVMKACAAFSRQGYEVDLYAQKPNSKESNDVFKNYGVDKSFKIVRTKRPKIKGGGLFYRIFSNIKICFRKYDFFFARNVYHARSILFFKKKVILEVHDVPHSKKAFRAIERVILSKQFVLLVVISDALKEEYYRLFPDLKQKEVIVAHDCADIPNNTCEQCGRLNVGYVGHLYSGRGIEIIFEVAKRLPRTTFYIVGGTENDIKRLKNICSLDNVIFEGFVPNGELYKHYCKFDIVVAPYQKKVAIEGGGGDTSKYMSPLKIFEYMSYKKAIICSDLPVLKEVLKDGGNALLCPCEDIDSWSSAVQKLIESECLRKKLVSNAYEDLLKNFTWDGRIKRIMGTIKKSSDEVYNG